MKHIVTLSFLLAGIIVFGQKVDQRSLKEANDYYDNFLYHEAIRKYELANDSTTQTLRRLGNAYWKVGDISKAKACYELVAKSEEASDRDMMNYASILRENENYEESELWIKKVYELNAEDNRVNSYMNDLGSYYELQKDNGQFELKNLGINSEQQDFGAIDYKDKVVFVSSRERVQLIYRRWNTNQLPYLDVYIADSLDQAIETPEEISKHVNKKFHEGPVAFSPDGNEMIFTRNNYQRNGADKVYRLHLYKTVLKDGEWQKPEKLSFNSPDYSCGHAAYGPEGKWLYFVSDMPGGMGGTDVYKIPVHEDGTFGQVVNLGPKVNTEGNEMFPYMHPSNDLLFFSSNGHVGLGGLDVFVASVNEDLTFDKVMNLGAPVNSSRDDFSFVLDAEKKTGYMASNRAGGKGGDDIYGVTMLNPIEFEIVPTFDCPIYANPELTIKMDLAESIDTNSVPLEYIWTFEDGEVLKGTVVEKTFPYPGVYTVKVDILDIEAGMVEKAELTETFNLEDINFIGYSHKPSYKVNEVGSFDASVSYMEGITFTDYYWKVNDLVLENRTPHMEYLFDTAGDYEIALQVNGEDENRAPKSFCYKQTFSVLLDTTIEDVFADNTFENKESLNSDIQDMVNEHSNDLTNSLNDEQTAQLENELEELLVVEDSELELNSEVEIASVKTVDGEKVVEGVLRDENGDPIVDREFRLLDGEGTLLDIVRTDGDGNFSLSLSEDEFAENFEIETEDIVSNNTNVDVPTTVLENEIAANVEVTDAPDTKTQVDVNSVLAEGDNRVIEGTLTDDSGTALANQTFDLLDDKGNVIETVTTDAEGNFSVDVTEDELADNFTTEAEDIVSNNTNVDVPTTVLENEIAANVEVADAPDTKTQVKVSSVVAEGDNRVIEGTLTDDSGAALANQTFDLLDDKGDVIETVTTDAEGNFSVDVTEDELADNFTTEAEDIVSNNTNVEVRTTVLENEIAANVEVADAPDTKTQVEVSSVVAEGDNRVIEGTLTDDSGAALANQTFDLLDDKGNVIETVTTDAEGNFSVDVTKDELANNFTTEAEDIVSNNTNVEVPTTVLENEITANVEVADAPDTKTQVEVSSVVAEGDNRVIEGTLTDDSGTALANQTFDLLDDKGNVIETVTTDAEGNFSVDVTEDELADNFTTEAEDIVSNNTNVDVPTTVLENEIAANVEVTDAPDTKTQVEVSSVVAEGDNRVIEGTLTDDSGVALANQTFDLLDDKGNVIETVTTDAEGNFSVDVTEDELADNFTTEAEDIVSNNTSVDAPTTVLENEIAANVEVADAPDTKTQIEVSSVVAEGDNRVIEGTLTDDSGTALANQTFDLLDDKGNVIETVTTDAEGNFSVDVTEDELADNFTTEAEDQIAVNAGNPVATNNEAVNTNINNNSNNNGGVGPVDGNNTSGTLAEVTIIPIYFDFDKHTIRPDAAKELDKLVKMMNDNPEMEIEISAHTDARGAAAYNQVLSDKRAKATIDYIKKRISNPGRVTGKGFGETNLVNECADGVKCSEKKHQENRRAEFIVIKR